ncbi:MAG TPA: NAD(P)-dependent oxidoreductase [Solirubrobacteraceae bacterium]|jgi:3-hydroxyisobutyrate dehydrogenase-like beta-hydroxyacid dehydrogenase
MTKIAFLGLGIMGSRMAANLAGAGHELTVWNRTAATAEDFASAHSVTAAPTPAAAAAHAEIVFTMVVDGPQVRDVLLGEDGAAHGATPGTLFVDCSTIGPAWTLELGESLEQRRFSLLDAPVTGSSPKAQDGTLTFMVGATEQEFETVRPALEAMGSLIVRCGPRGQGQMVKLLNNAIAVSNAATLAQALVVARRAGADMDALVEVIASGAAGSTMVDLKARPMLAHDFTTLFKLEHMLKDVALCLEEGRRLQVPFPSAAYAQELLIAGMARGRGPEDFAAIVEPVEDQAGLRL